MMVACCTIARFPTEDHTMATVEEMLCEIRYTCRPLTVIEHAVDGKLYVRRKVIIRIIRIIRLTILKQAES